jgi:hypothetical protein
MAKRISTVTTAPSTPRQYIGAGKCKMQFVFTEDLRDWLRAQADAEETTMTDVLIRAADEYRAKRDKAQARRTARMT